MNSIAALHLWERNARRKIMACASKSSSYLIKSTAVRYARMHTMYIGCRGCSVQMCSSTFSATSYSSQLQR